MQKLKNPNRLKDPKKVEKKKCPICDKRQLVKNKDGSACLNCPFENKNEIRIEEIKYDKEMG